MDALGALNALPHGMNENIMVKPGCDAVTMMGDAPADTLKVGARPPVKRNGTISCYPRGGQWIGRAATGWIFLDDVVDEAIIDSDGAGTSAGESVQ